MGTFVTVKVVAESAAQAQKIIDAAFREIEKIERLMSGYREDSEISQLNRLAHKAPLAVSAQTFEVLVRSREISHASGGAFDVTTAPLIELWQKAADENLLPQPEEIARAKSCVDFRKVILNEKQHTVFFARPGISLDLGGIAKGYAVDKAIEAIKREGAEAALVDAGGDIYALGFRPEGNAWRIKIQDPAGGESGLGVLELSNKAVVTSGNYQRFFEIEGKRYSHIIDPRSGWPAEGVASVTVIAPEATLADGWATGLSVLGETEGLKLVESLPDVECLMVVGEKGDFRQAASSGFSKYLTGSSP
jgi:thiamine biosynthesis lipoprotein